MKLTVLPNIFHLNINYFTLPSRRRIKTKKSSKGEIEGGNILAKESDK